MPDDKNVKQEEESKQSEVQPEPVQASDKAHAELAKLEARRLELKKQTPEQAKDRNPDEYGKVKGRIAELKAQLGE